jgi:hypothetical protein
MTSGQTWGSDFSGCNALVVVLFTEYQNFVKTLADSSPELTQLRVGQPFQARDGPWIAFASQISV